MNNSYKIDCQFADQDTNWCSKRKIVCVKIGKDGYLNECFSQKHLAPKDYLALIGNDNYCCSSGGTPIVLR